MKKADVKAGELYAADGPGESWRCAKRVKVLVLETDVVLERTRRGATIRGTRVRLEEDAISRGSFEPTRRAAGEEYDLPNKRISHPWTDADDEQRVEQARAAEEKAALRARLLAMGLPEHVSYFERRRRPPGDLEDIEGFIVRVDTVVLDTPIFAKWLERIDPVKIAGEAIDEYAREERMAVASGAKAKVLAEIAEGIAVTDAELAPDG